MTRAPRMTPAQRAAFEKELRQLHRDERRRPHKPWTQRPICPRTNGRAAIPPDSDNRVVRQLVRDVVPEDGLNFSDVPLKVRCA